VAAVLEGLHTAERKLYLQHFFHLRFQKILADEACLSLATAVLLQLPVLDLALKSVQQLTHGLPRAQQLQVMAATLVRGAPVVQSLRKLAKHAFFPPLGLCCKAVFVFEKEIAVYSVLLKRPSALAKSALDG
jgi:hypothetical protein